MTTQMLFQQIPENVNYSRDTKKKGWCYNHAKRLIRIHQPLNMPYISADSRYKLYISHFFSVLGHKKTIAQFGKWAVFTTILASPRGRCTFQLFHFSKECPDILNVLSPVVSMALCQYLHAFCPPKATKEDREAIERKKVNSFYTSQSCI